MRFQLVGYHEVHFLVTNYSYIWQTERSLICSDTGALMQEPPKRFQPYKK